MNDVLFGVAVGGYLGLAMCVMIADYVSMENSCMETSFAISFIVGVLWPLIAVMVLGGLAIDKFDHEY